MKSSGIDGQSVSDGVMMRCANRAAVAVRRPDGRLDIKKAACRDLKKVKAFRIPVIRGIIFAADTLVTGFKAFDISDTEMEVTEGSEEKKSGSGSFIRSIFEMILAVIIVIAMFCIAPVLLSDLLKRNISSGGLLTFLEELTRILLFMLFMALVSLNRDIKNIFRYNGAVNKTVNCVEKKLDPVPANIKKMSRTHTRCNMGYLFTVVFVSIILFCFIKIQQPALRVLVRILVIPVVSGLTYELMIISDRSQNSLVRVVYAPAMWLQHFVVREPDEKMLETASECMKEIFDWKAFYNRKSDDETSTADAEKISGKSKRKASDKKHEKRKNSEKKIYTEREVLSEKRNDTEKEVLSENRTNTEKEDLSEKKNHDEKEDFTGKKSDKKKTASGKSSSGRRRRSKNHESEERIRIREAHKEEIRKNRLERERLIRESEEAEKEFNEILAEVDRHEKEKAVKNLNRTETDEDLKNLDVYLFHEDDGSENKEGSIPRSRQKHSEISGLKKVSKRPENTEGHESGGLKEDGSQHESTGRKESNRQSDRSGQKESNRQSDIGGRKESSRQSDSRRQKESNRQSGSSPQNNSRHNNGRNGSSNRQKNSRQQKKRK